MTGCDIPRVSTSTLSRWQTHRQQQTDKQHRGAKWLLGTMQPKPGRWISGITGPGLNSLDSAHGLDLHSGWTGFLLRHRTDRVF